VLIFYVDFSISSTPLPRLLKLTTPILGWNELLETPNLCHISNLLEYKYFPGYQYTMNWNGGARSRFQPANHGQFHRTYQLDNRRGENGIYGFTEHLENKRRCTLLDFVKAEFPGGSALALQLSHQMELDKELIPADDGQISGRTSPTDHGDDIELGRRSSMSEDERRGHRFVLGNTSRPNTRASSMSEDQLNGFDRGNTSSLRDSRFSFRARTSALSGTQNQGGHFDRSLTAPGTGLTTGGIQRPASSMFGGNARFSAAASTGWASQRDPFERCRNTRGTDVQNGTIFENSFQQAPHTGLSNILINTGRGVGQNTNSSQTRDMQESERQFGFGFQRASTSFGDYRQPDGRGSNVSDAEDYDRNLNRDRLVASQDQDSRSRGGFRPANNTTSAATSMEMERSNIVIGQDQGFSPMQTNNNEKEADENGQDVSLSSSPEMWTTPPDVQASPTDLEQMQ